MTHRASANTLITTTTHGHHPTRSGGGFHRCSQLPPPLVGQPAHVGRGPPVRVDHDPRWLGVDAPSLPGGLHPPRLLIRLGFRPGGCHHLQRMEPEGTVPAAFGGAVLLLPLLRV